MRQRQIIIVINIIHILSLTRITLVFQHRKYNYELTLNYKNAQRLLTNDCQAVDA